MNVGSTQQRGREGRRERELLLSPAFPLALLGHRACMDDEIGSYQTVLFAHMGSRPRRTRSNYHSTLPLETGQALHSISLDRYTVCQSWDRDNPAPSASVGLSTLQLRFHLSALLARKSAIEKELLQVHVRPKSYSRRLLKAKSLEIDS